MEPGEAGHGADQGADDRALLLAQHPVEPIGIVHARPAPRVVGCSAPGQGQVDRLGEPAAVGGIDRSATKDTIYLSFSAFGRPLGTNIHRVGTGWSMFELPTADYAGKQGDLSIEVSASSALGPYCFEADVR